MKTSADQLLALAKRFEYFVSSGAKRNIDKSQLNSLRTFDKRLQYLTDGDFDILGFGTGRCVILVNQRKVIKLAMNEKGLAQNRTEFGILSGANSPWFPKALDKAPDDSWIEVELVKTLSSFNEVYAALGTDHNTYHRIFNACDTMTKDKGLDLINTIEELKAYRRRQAQYIVENRNSRNTSKGITPITVDDYLKKDPEYLQLQNGANNKKLIDLIETLFKFDLPTGEYMDDPSHFGITGDGRLVITDAGLTSDVYGNFYYKSPYQKAREEQEFELDYQKENKPFEYGNKIEIYDNNNQPIPEMPYTSKDPKNIIQPI